MLFVHLFGKFGISTAEQVTINIDARRLQDLLAYLLVFRVRPHPRETLAGLFWGDYDTNRSLKYLRQSLWQLQSALGQPGETPLLEVDGEWVQVSGNAHYWLDINEFETACILCEKLPTSDFDEQAMQVLRSAADLYRGDLMDGSYADWCLFERERLQNRYFILLVRLMECCELHQAYEAGLDYGQRVLRINPAHERTHQQMMRLYSLAGFRSMALRQYQNCGQALRDELGVKPSRQTQALFEQIRDDHFEGAQMRYPVHEISLKPAGGNAPETALRQHLEQLCRSLEEIQHKVHNEIQEIRKLLK